MKLKSLLLSLMIVAAFAGAAHAADTPRTPTVKIINTNTLLATWTGLDGDDTGYSVDLGAFQGFCTVHVYSGTYGSSTITVEGSLDPRAAFGNADYASAEWAGLADINGTTLSKTADAIDTVAETPRFIRPKTASGTNADVAVAILCRKH